jgi:succinate dehydrogenase/fumarate reductase flavoprotein subunit
MARVLDDVARQSRVSRRDFLKAAGSTGVLTTATAATVVFQESAAYAQQRWDREVDVVVAGSGAAACSAAIFAREGGADVLMLEKAATFGGTTAKSGGGYWIPNNYLMRDKGLSDPRVDCLKYMARTAFPTIYNPSDRWLGLPENEYNLIAAFYDNASPTVDALRTLKVLDGHAFWIQGFDGQMFPDYYAQLPENKAPRGRTLFAANPDGSAGNGAVLIQRLKAGVDQRRIPVLLEHRVTRLIVNRKREVIGVEARTGPSQVVSIRARRGVIFGSGGFTANPDMCLNYLRGPIFGGCTVATGEGDFVHIGGAAGAKLANMNNAWLWPVLLEQALQSRSTPGGVGSLPGDSMIQVNKYGRRVVNEKIQYNERTQAHFLWDPYRAEYPNLILFMIYDQRTRERFGGTNGVVLRPGLNAPFIHSGQTLEELAASLDRRLGEIGSRTGHFRLDQSFTANIKDTIARYNQFAETGKDLDFHRGEAPIEFANHGARRPGNEKPNLMMYPIAPTGPYYAVMLGGGTLDTKGGPKVNGDAQVVDEGEKAIPGLYGAGNCVASPAGQAYWAGGATLGPALTFGALAGRHAAKSPIKDVS